MFDRSFLRQFFTYLERATLSELQSKRTQLHAALEQFREPEARRDARFLLKHVNREILDRQLFGPVDDVQ